MPKNNSEYLFVAESSEDSIWLTSTDGEILHANTAAQKTFGYSSRELLGKNLHELIHHSNEDGSPMKKEDCPLLQSYKNNKLLMNYMTIFFRKDGSKVYASCSKSEINWDDGVQRRILYIKNIAVTREIEKLVEKLALIAKTITSGVAMLDLKGNIEWANKSFYAIFDDRKETSIFDYLNIKREASNKKDIKHICAAIEKGKSFKINIKQEKSSRTYWQQIEGTPVFTEQGTLINYITMHSDVTEKKHEEDITWRLANYDPLTNIPNRRLFQDRLAFEIKRCERTRKSMALLFIDLDKFKQVNDMLGHSGGDILLIEVVHELLPPSLALTRYVWKEFLLVG